MIQVYQHKKARVQAFEVYSVQEQFFSKDNLPTCYWLRYAMNRNPDAVGAIILDSKNKSAYIRLGDKTTLLIKDGDYIVRSADSDELGTVPSSVFERDYCAIDEDIKKVADKDFILLTGLVDDVVINKSKIKCVVGFDTTMTDSNAEVRFLDGDRISVFETPEEIYKKLIDKQ